MSKLILFGDSALEIYAHLALRPSDSIAFRGKPPAESHQRKPRRQRPASPIWRNSFPGSRNQHTFSSSVPTTVAKSSPAAMLPPSR